MAYWIVIVSTEEVAAPGFAAVSRQVAQNATFELLSRRRKCNTYIQIPLRHDLQKRQNGKMVGPSGRFSNFSRLGEPSDAFFGVLLKPERQPIVTGNPHFVGSETSSSEAVTWRFPGC